MSANCSLLNPSNAVKTHTPILAMSSLLLFRCHHSIPSLHQLSTNLCGIYLQNFSRARALDSGRALHAHLLISGKQSVYLCSKLIIFYTKCDRISYARQLFDQMPQRNLLCWIVLIGAYARNGLWEETLQLFHQMRCEGFKPNRFVFPSVLKACANLSALEIGGQVHNLILVSETDSDVFVDGALIDMYSKCGQIEKARKVFDEMPQRDLVVWNSMVAGYAQQGLAEEAWKLFEEMRSTGLEPDLITWNTLIAGFSQLGDSTRALNLFQMMEKEGMFPDTVSWTAMITGFVQNCQNQEAFRLLRDMILSGSQPSTITISSILPACGNSKQGREIHGYTLVIGIEGDVFVSSSLLDMYAKCGLIAESRRVFDKMPVRSIVSWNSMIFAYANHGYGSDAIKLFDTMEKEEVKPDHITFTAVFTACSRAEMVEHGQNCFEKMQEKYRIVPRVEHFGCIVDLLGRSGKLLEAYNLIKKMPMKPDSYVWGALLGACRIHGDIELGRTAAKQLFELEPESSGSYVLLSNIFAGAGRWGDASEIKMRMKKRRMRRDNGCSWVQAG